MTSATILTHYIPSKLNPADPCPEVCIPLSILSSQLSLSPTNCDPSSKTTTPACPPQLGAGRPLPVQSNCFRAQQSPEESVAVSHQTPLTASGTGYPKPLNTYKSTYPADLTPLPSSLQPTCAARDCLQKWQPAPHTTHDPHSSPTTFQESNLNQIKDVIAHAWAESTKESYGSSLLVFHIFCDSKSIPDHDHTPANSELISMFISSLTGQYSGSTIANYLQGVHTWHIMHRLDWLHNNTEIEVLLKAAVTLAPISSKCKPCKLYTIAVLSLMHDSLDLTDLARAAVFACLTTTF
ncbi:hypothetical protein PAXRUDRAFT_153115 [Paxillus rubicundulus Ve08.2h10]|uniref:Core-binding (CB) domain-containing protein n=1 Tax=Paxillus rubicundulus Ve08.2h10 TaxID=930991 RepID=A0A0D0DTB6_9AGAM|nr:hypothetical protein PAXRUDRAFT_153115 [Paxillus rubicundulus Ve08.2h10]